MNGGITHSCWNLKGRTLTKLQHVLSTESKQNIKMSDQNIHSLIRARVYVTTNEFNVETNHVVSFLLIKLRYCHVYKPM